MGGESLDIVHSLLADNFMLLYSVVQWRTLSTARIFYFSAESDNLSAAWWLIWSIQNYAQENWKMAETLANGYSSDRTQQELLK